VVDRSAGGSSSIESSEAGAAVCSGSSGVAGGIRGAVVCSSPISRAVVNGCARSTSPVVSTYASTAVESSTGGSAGRRTSRCAVVRSSSRSGTVVDEGASLSSPVVARNARTTEGSRAGVSAGRPNSGAVVASIRALVNGSAVVAGPIIPGLAVAAEGSRTDVIACGIHRTVIGSIRAVIEG